MQNPERDELWWRNRGFEAIDREMERRMEVYLVAHAVVVPSLTVAKHPATKDKP